MVQLSKLVSVYCDESCHLNKDDSNVMALGAVYCPTDKVRSISAELRALKKKHSLNKHVETKWSKASPSKKAYYQELLNYFFSQPTLRFRGIIIPDKSKLDHERFSQTHDEWYYKMYYTMLLHIINSSHAYHFYLDIKDTQGGVKTRKLQDYLANKVFDFQKECIVKVQQIRSHESDILQLCDVLTGAITYGKRGDASNEAKNQVINTIKFNLPYHTLDRSTSYHFNKFNFLIWEAS